MSTTPPAVPPRSPRRRTPQRTPQRTPLQEQTKSQSNAASARLRQSPFEFSPANLVRQTPFPTKPEHVLKPNVARKQKTGQSAAPEIFSPSSTTSSLRNVELRPTPRNGNGQRPAVKLKRSVKALRDLYEAQAEEISRPSTATSRPGTAVSRARSQSSSEGLAGRSAWDQFEKITNDDLALLPAVLSRGPHAIKPVISTSSFSSRVADLQSPSSPNYEVFDITSSPRFPVYRDESGPLTSAVLEFPSSVVNSSSSPNVVRLNRSSSTGEASVVEDSSSPNVVKIGSSSPTNITSNMSSSPPGNMTPSGSPRKRKRFSLESAGLYASKPEVLASSPPFVAEDVTMRGAVLSSSISNSQLSASSKSQSCLSDRVDDSSPPWQTVDDGDSVTELQYVVNTHSSLQAALSSSPAPALQYPVVRAPHPGQMAGLLIPKRQSRSSQLDSISPKWVSRLSAVPSEGSGEGSVRSGRRSSFVEDLDDVENRPTTSNLPFIMFSPIDNESQIHINTDIDHHQEATDEVSALPRGEYAYRSPPLRPKWSGNLSSSSGSSNSRMHSVRNSMDNRLNSMKSFSQSRHNSLQSGVKRPGSSGSTVTQVAFPTWAKRYYSGTYQTSSQPLSNNRSNYSRTDLPLPALPTDRSRPGTAKSKASRPRSWISFKDSLNEYVPSLIRPKRKRLNARQSHIMPGFGPLVSNPITTSADGVIVLDGRPGPGASVSTIRLASVSDSSILSPADPRAHWAGITNDKLAGFDSSSTDGHHQKYHSRMSSSMSSSYGSVIRHAQYPHGNNYRNGTMSPHLHHDQRLNTGSSVSRGYGFPFNLRSRYAAPSLMDYSNEGIFHVDARTFQISLFMLGFLMPLSWFLAAVLPLPKRPDAYHDLEKACSDPTQNPSHQSYRHQYTASGTLEISNNEWDDMDVVAKLRLQRHIKGLEEIKWQNARWWRSLNRWMCIVGAALLVIVIVLAIIGTRGGLR